MALLQVKTENGIVEGLPAGNQSVSIFKGIPFAKPPVGDLRWKGSAACGGLGRSSSLPSVRSDPHAGSICLGRRQAIRWQLRSSM